MNAGVKWSDESTREFIQLRYKLRHLFNGRKHQCEKAYSRIVDELGLRNVISPTQARKKWSNLLQKYMDIKGGYSTANPDWPYYQILDQIVPLMRKEKIEKLSPSVDRRELDVQEILPSPLSSAAPDPEPLNMPGVQEDTTATSGVEKCKDEEPEVASEPPRKRGRSRRAAQRARDRWWGAVEDSDLGEAAVGSVGGRSEAVSQASFKTASVDSLEPTQMELQTFNMLETCSSALTEIRDVLKAHTERQERLMKSFQDTVTSQNNSVKEIMNTLSSQNATLIRLITQLTTTTTTPSNTTTTTPDKSTMQHPPTGMSASGGGSYTKESLRQHSHSRQEIQRQPQQQHLPSQQSLMNALTQQPQQCNSPMVDSPEIITGL